MISWSVALYRRLLSVYPQSFRRRNSKRMIETFAELCNHALAASGLTGLLRLWLHTLVDVASTSVAVRRSDTPRTRAPRKGILMDDLFADIRYSLRTLRRNPGFAAIAIMTMALGIGVNAAMFSFVDAVVLRPLPYTEPQRLIEVWETYEGNTLERRNVGYPTLLDWRQRVTSFEEVAAITTVDIALTDVGEAQRVTAQVVDPQFFDLLGVSPWLGRVLEEGDNAEFEQAPVAVLSHAMWQTTFGGNEGILGSTIQLNGVATVMVGVMPPGFSDPYGMARLWLPLLSGLRVNQQPRGAFESRGNRGLRALARLAPEATLVSAQSELDAVTLQLRDEHGEIYADRGALALSLEDQVLGTTRAPVLLLMGAVGLVLLIACANVANLLMARAAGRDEEIAVRFALGAARSRLVRQLLTESTILALIGGAAGLLLAYWSLDALAAQVPFNVPEYVSVSINGTVVVFSIGVTLLTGVLFGLLPALTISGQYLSHTLTSARGASRRGRRIAGLDGRGLLVAAEIALSLTLLVGAGLLLQSFAGMQTIEPGFSADGLLTASFELPASRYDREQITVFRADLLRNLRGAPGLEAAALAADTPLLSGYSAIIVANEEGLAADPEETIRVYRHSVSPGYIDAMGAELLAGREFEASDTADSPAVALVSETMAARAWPGENPVGQRLTRNGRDWITVVGVVRDIRHRQLVVDPFVNPDDPDVYFPLAQDGARELSVLLRAREDPGGLLQPLRRQLAQMDADLPLFDIYPMREVVADELAINRASARMLTAFGGLALLLAAIGIYGVMATAVAARSREIGIRVALGAPKAHIVGMVLRQGITMGLIGIVVGIGAALAAARLIESLLYGVSARDPVTIALVAGVLLAATALASYVPVRRALAMDPATSLQAE
jgi:putative ABC transport system permease protein